MYLCIIYISYNEIHSLYILNRGWSPIVTASWECKVFHSFGEPRLQIYTDYCTTFPYHLPINLLL